MPNKVEVLKTLLKAAYGKTKQSPITPAVLGGAYGGTLAYNVAAGNIYPGEEYETRRGKALTTLAGAVAGASLFGRGKAGFYNTYTPKTVLPTFSKEPLTISPENHFRWGKAFSTVAMPYSIGQGGRLLFDSPVETLTGIRNLARVGGRMAGEAYYEPAQFIANVIDKTKVEEKAKNAVSSIADEQLKKVREDISRTLQEYMKNQATADAVGLLGGSLLGYVGTDVLLSASRLKDSKYLPYEKRKSRSDLRFGMKILGSTAGGMIAPFLLRKLQKMS
jgi:hypothetical protein